MQEVKLAEISPVTFPAYQGTTVSVRHENAEITKMTRTEREVAVRKLKAGTATKRRGPFDRAAARAKASQLLGYPVGRRIRGMTPVERAQYARAHGVPLDLESARETMRIQRLNPYEARIAEEQRAKATKAARQKLANARREDEERRERDRYIRIANEARAR